ncbi:MAG: MMPL family transporter [Desulfurivibrio sp.]|nr:MMPL family transporter [Desulfurivibrio sp.]
MIERILTFSSRRRWLALALILLITAVAGKGLLSLRIDTSYDSLFSPKDPGYPLYRQTIEEFGSDSTSVIFIRDSELFTVKKLRRLEDVHYALEDTAGVEKVKSIFNSQNIRDKDGFLVTEPLMDYVPDDPAALGTKRRDAIYNPLLIHNLIAEDGTVMAINVTTEMREGDPDFNRLLFEKIEEQISPLRDDFDEVFQVGPPRLNVEIERGMFADLSFLSPLSTGILILSIILFLRTIMAAGLPMATAGTSVLWTFGIMGFLGLPLNLLTAILPSLVIVIGSTEDTHMLSSYLKGLRDGNRDVAIRYMARHVGLPIFITSLTTAIGFSTNAISEITMIRDFALSTSIAMVMNLISTVLVLPLLLSVIGPRTSKLPTDESEPGGFVGWLIGKFLYLVENHAGKVLAVTAGLLLLLGSQAFNIRVSNDPLSYFKDDNQIIADANTLHERLAGMQLFYLTVQAAPGRDFKDPAELAKLGEVVGFLREQGVYDKVISITDHLSLVNREMNQGDQDYYRLPDSRNMVEQYLLLFQRGDLERYLNPDATAVNVLVRHNLSDSSELGIHLRKLEAELEQVFGNDNRYYLTGKNLMINRAAESLFSGQIHSLALLILIIFVIMSLLYTSVTAGFMSLVPNLIPVFVMFGVMGIFGIPLNPGTATVAVIAVGIAIDDTIHLLSRYNEECRTEPDHMLAVRRAVLAQAVPVISTSIALAAGFGILFISSFNIVAQFGTLAAITMICAMLSDLLVTPILLRHLRLVGLWDIVTLRVGREVLVESELFQNMSTFQIRKTILLSQMREYGVGEAIISEGSLGRDMYLLLDGEVKVERAGQLRDQTGGRRNFWRNRICGRKPAYRFGDHSDTGHRPAFQPGKGGRLHALLSPHSRLS